MSVDSYGREEKAREWTDWVYSGPSNNRFERFMSIAVQGRPRDVHINHWRSDVMTRFIDHYVDYRRLVGRESDNAECLAYLDTFNDVLSGRVPKPLIRPRSSLASQLWRNILVGDTYYS